MEIHVFNDNDIVYEGDDDVYDDNDYVCIPDNCGGPEEGWGFVEV